LAEIVTVFLRASDETLVAKTASITCLVESPAHNSISYLLLAFAFPSSFQVTTWEPGVQVVLAIGVVTDGADETNPARKTTRLRV